MKRIFYLFIVFSMVQTGCLFKDKASDSGSNFVQYEFSSGNQSNYTAPLTAAQIAQDLKSIKTIFTLMDMEDQMIFPMAKKAGSLAKTSVGVECLDMNEMQDEMFDAEDGFTNVSVSWTMSDGKPLVVCSNDADPYSKMDNSLMAVTASGVQDNISMNLKMNMLIDILRKGDKIEGMNMKISSHVSATVMSAFTMEAVLSGTMGGDFMSEEGTMTGNLTMELSILDGRYRCSTSMSFNSGSLDEEPEIQSCDLTHNGQKVGTLDFTREPPVILDVNGNPVL